MEKKFFKLFSLILAAFLTVSLFAGCAKENGDNDEPNKGQDMDTGKGDDAITEAQEEEFSYPMDTNVKVTWWHGLNPNVSKSFESANETEFAKELEKKTGIDIEFMHPTSDEQFGLMVATGELPDIVEYSWDKFYSGGTPKAIEDKVIIPLNGLMEEGYMPNYVKWLSENPMLDKMIKTNEGLYGGLAPIEDGKSILGPLVRKDWLDDLGLDRPETSDEWYEMLVAFRDKKGAEAPMTKRSSRFATFFHSIYGVGTSFFVEDGKVHYGPYDSRYKDVMGLVNHWYKEGLLDKDIVTMNKNLEYAKMTNGTSGALVGYTGHISLLEDIARETDSNYTLTATKWPVLKKGDTPKFGHKSWAFSLNNRVASITAACKHPEIAARLLDYIYGEEGQMLANFGIEGISYNVEAGGKIVPTEIMHNDPDERSFFQMKGIYTRSYATGPYVRHPQMTTFDLTLPSQWEAVELWSDSNELDHKFPSIRTDVADAEEMGNIMAQIKTYNDEMYLKFLLGEESLDKFDKYMDQLKKMGIERAIEIYQKAYDRYLSD